MDKNRWIQITEIVDDLLETNSSADRKKILNERCGDDPKLRKQVLNLLRSIESSSEYWNTLFQRNRLFIGELTQHYKTMRFESGVSGMIPPIPYKIDRYFIQKRIGFKAIGEVYLATLTDDKSHQKLFLTHLRPEFNLYQKQGWIEREQPKLTTLRHPNIARFLDSGISKAGRSYYVMENVDGIPVTEYCRKNRPGLSQRLSLFKQVCRAVQYAHSNSIVHCHLKPENILVNKKDEIKILDFGIARIIDKSLNKQALLKLRGEFDMLNLKYAAPEQKEFEPITAMADVYSLGVLLYELFTDSRQINKLKQAHSSVKIQLPEYLHTIPEGLQAFLTGGLEAVIQKSISQEPSRRFNSAKALMEEIERYLN